MTEKDAATGAVGTHHPVITIGLPIESIMSSSSPSLRYRISTCSWCETTASGSMSVSESGT